MSKHTPSHAEIEHEIESIKRELLALGSIHPGSMTSQYHACGQPSCRCHDAENPQKHGPYFKLTYSQKSKYRCRFVRPECVEELQQRLANYKTMRVLIARWIALSVEAGEEDFFSKSAANSPDPRPSKS